MEGNIGIRKRGRPKKIKSLSSLTKLEKENIYYEYDNGGSELSLVEFSNKMSLAPIEMSKFLREYQVSTGEDVSNELKAILKTDSAIVKNTQQFILEYLDDLRQSKKKITDKQIETLLKASDSALKRQTIIDKMMSDKAEGNKSAPMEIKLTL